MRTRVHITKAAEPTVFEKNAAGEFATLPHVLTVEAVAKAELPPLGSSGLPVTLEAHVPSQFRYWKAATLEQARDTRDALVDEGVFAEGAVVKVDGAHRLVVRRSFLAGEYAADETADLAKRLPALVHASSALLLPTEKQVDALQLDVADLGEIAKSELWIAEVAKTDASVAAIRKHAWGDGVRAFEFATRPESVFVTNVATKAGVPHLLDVPLSEPMAKRDVRLFVSKADAPAEQVEERFALGVVLEPDVVDSQMDTYDVPTIRKAAHDFMQYYRNVGLQHQAYVTGRIEILESYLAPVDMVVEGMELKMGTWLMGLRFVDDALWKKVKAGEITGLSIGGTAIREPDEPALDPV